MSILNEIKVCWAEILYYGLLIFLWLIVIGLVVDDQSILYRIIKSLV